MIKSPRSAAPEQSRERIVLVDALEQQMLDLKALRKEVAAAERAAAVKRRYKVGSNVRRRTAPARAFPRFNVTQCVRQVRVSRRR
jgi:hypothetical protein